MSVNGNVGLEYDRKSVSPAREIQALVSSPEAGCEAESGYKEGGVSRFANVPDKARRSSRGWKRCSWI